MLRREEQYEVGNYCSFNFLVTVKGNRFVTVYLTRAETLSLFKIL